MASRQWSLAAPELAVGTAAACFTAASAETKVGYMARLYAADGKVVDRAGGVHAPVGVAGTCQVAEKVVLAAHRPRLRCARCHRCSPCHVCLRSIRPVQPGPRWPDRAVERGPIRPRRRRSARRTRAGEPALLARLDYRRSYQSRPARIPFKRCAFVSMWAPTSRTARARSSERMAARMASCSARRMSGLSNSRSSTESTMR